MLGDIKLKKHLILSSEISIMLRMLKRFAYIHELSQRPVAQPLPSFHAFVKLNKTFTSYNNPISYLCSTVNNENLIMYLEFTVLFPW